MSSIHILALDTTRKGGAGVYTANLAKQLAASGHEVTLVCHEATADVKQICTVFEIPLPVKDRPYGMWRFGALLQLLDYKRHLSLLNLSEANITIGSAQPMILAYMALFPSARLIYIPHSMVAPVELASYEYGDIIQRHVMIKAYDYMEKKSLRMAKATIRFSKLAAKTFQTFYGKRTCGNLLVLPMPIDIPSDLEYRNSHSCLNLLFVGRLIESKNVSFLLKILSQTSKTNWHLNIVGDGPLKQQLILMAEKLGLNNRVTFHGHCDDVSQHYRNADLFVFPSLLESYAIVIVEAMSYELPVLAYRADGKNFINVSEEIISDGINGLLASNETEFDDLLKQCIEQKIPLIKFGQAARQSTVENCSWNKHLNQITELTQKIETQKPIAHNVGDIN